MQPIASDLEEVARRGHERFASDATAAAQVSATRGVDDTDARLTAMTKRELFQEAILNAAKSHFQEIKTVTR